MADLKEKQSRWYFEVFFSFCLKATTCFSQRKLSLCIYSELLWRPNFYVFDSEFNSSVKVLHYNTSISRYTVAQLHALDISRNTMSQQLNNYRKSSFQPSEPNRTRTNLGFDFTRFQVWTTEHASLDPPAGFQIASSTRLEILERASTEYKLSETRMALSHFRLNATWPEVINITRKVSKVQLFPTELRSDPNYYNIYCLGLNTSFAMILPLLSLLFLNLKTVRELKKMMQTSWVSDQVHDLPNQRTNGSSHQSFRFGGSLGRNRMRRATATTIRDMENPSSNGSSSLRGFSRRGFSFHHRSSSNRIPLLKRWESLRRPQYFMGRRE